MRGPVWGGFIWEGCFRRFIEHISDILLVRQVGFICGLSRNHSWCFKMYHWDVGGDGGQGMVFIDMTNFFHQPSSFCSKFTRWALKILGWQWKWTNHRQREIGPLNIIRNNEQGIWMWGRKQTSNLYKCADVFKLDSRYCQRHNSKIGSLTFWLGPLIKQTDKQTKKQTSYFTKLLDFVFLIVS